MIPSANYDGYGIQVQLSLQQVTSQYMKKIGVMTSLHTRIVSEYILILRITQINLLLYFSIL